MSATRTVDDVEQKLIKSAKGGLFGYGANPEDQFQLALHLWKKIASVITALHIDEQGQQAFLNVLPQLDEVKSWLKKAAKKNHFEATRCYASLALDLIFGVYYARNNRQAASFVELRALLMANKKTVQSIKKLIDKPIFKEDELTQSSLMGCLMAGSITDIQRSFEMTAMSSRGMSQYILAFMIVSARKFKFSIPEITKALKEAEQKSQSSDLEFIAAVHLYPLQFKEILARLKNYTLDDARKLLESIKLPFEPLQCSLYVLPTMPEELAKQGIKVLLDDIRRLASPVNNTLMTAALLQGQDEMKQAARRLSVAVVETKVSVAPAPQRVSEATQSDKMVDVQGVHVGQIQLTERLDPLTLDQQSSSLLRL